MSLLTLDQNLTTQIYSFTRDNSGTQLFFYIIATFLIVLLPLMLVWLFWRKNSRWIALKIFIFAIFTWQVLNQGLGGFLYSNYGWRDRPFVLTGLQELFFEQPPKAFPSDHAAVFMFAVLALLYYRQKLWAKVFLIAMILSSFARVAIGFHWVGDIFGGWVVGLIGFGLLFWLDRPIQKFLDKISIVGGKPPRKAHRQAVRYSRFASSFRRQAAQHSRRYNRTTSTAEHPAVYSRFASSFRRQAAQHSRRDTLRKAHRQAVRYNFS